MSYRLAGRSFVSMLVAGGGEIVTPSGARVVAANTIGASLSGTPKAIANTETVVISFVVPAGTFQVGDVIRAFASAGRTGAIGTSGIARIRIGPTTLTGTEVATLNGASTTNPGGSTWAATAVITSIGTGGKAQSGGFTSINTGAGAVGAGNHRNVDGAVNTTIDNFVELTFISGNAGNTYTFNMATMSLESSSSA